jgi:hypothetical protein
MCADRLHCVIDCCVSIVACVVCRHAQQHTQLLPTECYALGTCVFQYHTVSNIVCLSISLAAALAGPTFGRVCVVIPSV